MIKRLAVTLLLTLGVLSASYAEIKLKDLKNGQVEITFQFKDPSSEMGVIGSFNNWTVPGEPMAKNAAGVWEKTITALATDEIVYKFYSKGTWLQDEMAPDKKDDGYGGKNGLIVVADILSGATPVTPAAKPAEGPAGAAAALPSYGSKLNFGMYTILGSKSVFSTQGVSDKTQKGLEADTTGLKAKSYWKIGGTLLPNVTAWFEMKAFDATQPIWAQDSTGKVTTTLNQGLSNMGYGLLFNPVNYLGGTNPSLNSLKTGLDTPYIVWETGYGGAKPQKRTSLIWTTLNDYDGGNGYMRFDLGKEWGKVGDFTVEAAVAPNVMTGNLSLFSWVSVQRGDTKVDFQYDVKSAQTSDLAKAFDKLYHQDFILGAKTKVAGIDLAAQGLMNQFSEASFAPQSNLSGEIKGTWALPNDVFGTTLGYRFTGDGSSMIYGNNDDSFGAKGVQRILANVWGKPVAMAKLGADTSVSLTTKKLSDNAFELYGKPWAEFSLDGITAKKASLNTYLKAKYNLLSGYQYAATQNAFELGEVGAKYYQADPIKGVINGMDVYYGMNAWEADKVLHTLITNLNLPKDAAVQAGLGLRTTRDYASETVKKNNNVLALTLGGSIKINEPAIKTPLFYTAFVYNMDPYDDDTNNLKMSDYVTDGGIAKNDGKAILRVLMKWDF